MQSGAPSDSCSAVVPLSPCDGSWHCSLVHFSVTRQLEKNSRAHACRSSPRAASDRSRSGPAERIARPVWQARETYGASGSTARTSADTCVTGEE